MNSYIFPKPFTGYVMVSEIPPTVVGDDLITRVRIVVYRENGDVDSDITRNQIRIIGGAKLRHYFR